MDISDQKTKLNSDITLFTRIGAFSAIVAVSPLIWVLFDVLSNHGFFKENELGDFIGGTSGTFASFAGLAFVYVGFLGQRLQILMQQEELELNRKELHDTREEIKGQREQLELQNKHFENQLFESTFFDLLENYKVSNSNSFRGSWAVDFNKKLDLLIEKNIPDGYGGSIPIFTNPLTFEELDKSTVTNSIREFPEDFLFGVKDALAPLIPILNHIKQKTNTHHLQTVVYSISKRDKLIFFYYFISNEDFFHPDEKTELKKLFGAFPKEAFKSISHIKWL